MRLAALFILEHYLFMDSQTINLVGEYFYSFKKEGNKIFIERVKNDNYVENLYPEGVTELSALVGANGSGKTTIFSIINKNQDTTKAIFVYENKEQEIVIENRTGKVNEHGTITEIDGCDVYFDKKKLNSKVNVDIPVLYYSPIADSDLERFNSPISKTSHFKSTLFEYHLDNVERSLMLMTDNVVDEIRKVYPKLPVYDHLSIMPKPLHKRDLRNVYGGFKIEGDVEKSMKESLEMLWSQYENTEKEHLTHDSKDFFKDLEVNLFSFIVLDGTSMITDFNGVHEVPFESFIKEEDFYVKLDNFFLHKIAHIDRYIYREVRQQLKNTKEYIDLLKLFEGNNFNSELIELRNDLLSMIKGFKDEGPDLKIMDFLSLISTHLQSFISTQLKGREFENLRDNLQKFANYLFDLSVLSEEDPLDKILSNLQIIEDGVKLSFKSLIEARIEIITQLKDGVKRAIRIVDSIKKMYLRLDSLTKANGVELSEGVLRLNLKEASYEDLSGVIQIYKKIIQEFNTNSVIRAQIFEFRPNKRLSFGEKSLLNLFSSLYEFTIEKYYHTRRKENYIILLDEADLGFHPLWKKGYVNVIAKVIPVIFSKLNDDIDNSELPELDKRKIQLVMTTHDCLTLSDIPSYNITYLERYVNENSDYVKVLSSKENPGKSFGANVNDLLSDSFFIEDSLMGDFAKETIESIISWIEKSEDLKKGISLSEIDRYKKLVSIIDEPVIRIKLSEMIDELAESSTEFQKEMIQREIDLLQKKKDSL